MALELKKVGSVWHVRGRYAGRQYSRSTRQSSKTKAQKWLNEFVAKLATEQSSGKVDRTLSQAYDSLTEEVPDWGDDRFIIPILKLIGSRSVHEIGNDTISELRKVLYPDAAAATVKRQLITPLKRVHNHAAERGWAQPVKWRRFTVEKSEPVWITASQLEDLLELCDERYQALLIFQYATGMRISEALKLRWKDVSPNMTHAVLPAAITKMNYSRRVWIQPRAREVLGKRKGPNDRLFDMFQVKHVQTIHKYLRNRHELKGFPVKVTTHTARHSWATWTYAMSTNLQYVMSQGGWRDAQTMLIYTHYATPDVAEDAYSHGWSWEFGPN